MTIYRHIVDHSLGSEGGKGLWSVCIGVPGCSNGVLWVFSLVEGLVIMESVCKGIQVNNFVIQCYVFINTKEVNCGKVGSHT